MTAHGAFHWNELNTRDVKKAKDFYKKTLGWTFEDQPMGPGQTYTIIKSNGQMVGGIFKMDGPMFKGIPENWFTYIAVDDVDKRLKKLKDAGGKVIREPWDVPTVGRIAIVADSGGAVHGWMVPAEDGM
jgi:hypothetical protein